MNCIAVDDEPLALEIIENHCSKLEQLDLVKTFTNPLKAFTFLKENDVDILFLDIQMPEINGLDLIKSLVKKPHVIITSAYKDYALAGFELDVSDYLLKPIHFDRFFKSINKVQKLIELENQEFSPLKKESSHSLPNDFMFVSTEHKKVKINYSEILYIEAWRDYVKIALENETILSLLSIRSLEEQLPKDVFIRVHRSFIVSKNHIREIDRNRIMVNQSWIPIGASYRLEFETWLNKYKVI